MTDLDLIFKLKELTLAGQIDWERLSDSRYPKAELYETINNDVKIIFTKNLPDDHCPDIIFWCYIGNINKPIRDYRSLGHNNDIQKQLELLHDIVVSEAHKNTLNKDLIDHFLGGLE